MAVIYRASVGPGRTVTELFMGGHSGRYVIRTDPGFAITDVSDTRPPGMSVVVATEPIRWHPAYWLWRWRKRG